jgi:hypothetical protein
MANKLANSFETLQNLPLLGPWGHKVLTAGLAKEVGSTTSYERALSSVPISQKQRSGTATGRVTQRADAITPGF